MLRPKDIRKNYNVYNSYFNFDECETLRTVEYLPNQGILFLKTFNSLHCVAPIRNEGGDVYRKTLTINIDSAQDAEKFSGCSILCRGAVEYRSSRL